MQRLISMRTTVETIKTGSHEIDEQMGVECAVIMIHIYSLRNALLLFATDHLETVGATGNSSYLIESRLAARASLPCQPCFWL
jgi:hypothetical protein